MYSERNVEYKGSVPNSVCWNITCKCNDTCEFCYREQNVVELSYQDKRTVIDKVAKAGVKKLTFAGGEPLLVENIKELILYAKQQGLVVSLTTNGILLENNDEDLFFLLRQLDWLTFSLDGADDVVQSKMSRNKYHASRVMKLLEISHNYSERKCKLKLNTVISSVNSEEIISIVDIVNRYNIERWKLFQFTPVRGSAEKNQNIYSISDEKYLQVVNQIKEALKSENVVVSNSDHENIGTAYFVIFPNGDIRVSESQGEKVVGNILSDEVSEMWNGGDYRKELHQQRTNFLKYIKCE